MRKLSAGLLVLMLLIPAAGAESAPIAFDFTLDFSTGPLAGQSFQGTVTVESSDCTAPGGLCDGLFDPDGPLDLLSFSVTVDGVTFTAADDTQFPDFPDVTFSNGVIVGIDFLTDPFVNPFLDIAWDADDNRVTFRNASFEASGGTVSAGSQVPEPGTLALFTLGLAAVGAHRRRARSGEKRGHSTFR